MEGGEEGVGSVDELLFPALDGRGGGMLERKGSRREKRERAHAKAEAGDEGERTASPDGKHGDVKGPVFGADLCDKKKKKNPRSSAPAHSNR